MIKKFRWEHWLIFLVLVSTSLGYIADITNFNGMTNPFTVYVTNNSNLSYGIKYPPNSFRTNITMNIIQYFEFDKNTFLNESGNTLQDGMIKDLALNGSIPTPGDTINNYGWTFTGTSPTYSNESNYTISGNRSIKIAPNQRAVYTWGTATTNFSGYIGMMVRFPDRYNISAYSSPFDVKVGNVNHIIYAFKKTYFTNASGKNCSTPVPIETNTSYLLLWNFTDNTTIKTYINGTMCSNFTRPVIEAHSVRIGNDPSSISNIYADNIFVVDGGWNNTGIKNYSSRVTTPNGTIDHNSSFWQLIDIRKNRYNDIIYFSSDSNCSYGNLSNNYCNLNVTLSTTNINLNMEVNISNSTYGFFLGNCTETYNLGYTNTSIVNVSFFDEDDRTALDVNVSGTFTLSNYVNQEDNYTINKIDVNKISLCSYPAGDFQLDSFLHYRGKGSSIEERYYILNLTVSDNETAVVNAYNFDNADGLSELSAIVTDLFQPLKDIYVKMLRFYPELNAWVTVQIDKTGEDGLALFYVRQNDLDYRFIFQNGTEILKTTSAVKFVCDLVDECEQTFPLGLAGDEDLLEDMTESITYNNLTNTITLRWNDPHGVVNDVRLLVQKETSLGTVTICDSSLAAATGSINCDVTGQSGVITALAFRSASPSNPWYSALFDLRENLLDSVAPTGETQFWGAMMIVVGGGLGITMPILGVIGVILAIWLNVFLQLGTLYSIGFAIAVSAFGIYIGFNIKKRQ